MVQGREWSHRDGDRDRDGNRDKDGDGRLAMPLPSMQGKTKAVSWWPSLSWGSEKSLAPASAPGPHCCHCYEYGQS